MAALAAICEAAGVEPGGELTGVGAGALSSAFPVTELAAAAVGAAALAVSELIGSRHGVCPRVIVDRRLVSLWFGRSTEPIGWALPPVWDPVAGDYRTEDGWIRLHTNAPHHRRAALAVLGVPAERDLVAAAVRRWHGDALETEIVAAGGRAARMRAWMTGPPIRPELTKRPPATHKRTKRKLRLLGGIG